MGVEVEVEAVGAGCLGCRSRVRGGEDAGDERAAQDAEKGGAGRETYSGSDELVYDGGEALSLDSVGRDVLALVQVDAKRL